MSDQNSVPQDGVPQHLAETEESILRALHTISDHYGSLDTAKQAMEKILQDSNLIQKVFLHGVAREKMKAMVLYLRGISILNEAVFSDEAKLRAMNTEQALQLLVLTHKLLALDIEIVDKNAMGLDADTILKGLAQEQTNTQRATEMLQDLSQESRERLLKAFAKVDKKLKSDE